MCDDKAFTCRSGGLSSEQVGFRNVADVNRLGREEGLEAAIDGAIKPAYGKWHKCVYVLFGKKVVRKVWTFVPKVRCCPS